MYSIVCFFFFFKQKTAYEMRISGWSSDVCSSDLSALVLAIFAIGIAVESIRHLVAPAAIAYGEALWIALLGLIVNLASAWLLGGGHHHGHEHAHAHDAGDHAHHDNNMRSAYFHVLADALTSVLAIGALLAGRDRKSTRLNSSH